LFWELGFVMVLIVGVIKQTFLKKQESKALKNHVQGTNLQSWECSMSAADFAS